jgi:Holliday junction resolvase
VFPQVPDAIRIGRIGELICAASIEQSGFAAAQVPHEGFDIVCFEGEKAYRIEVKSASKPDESSYRFMTSRGSKAKKLLSTEHCDIVAFVALDQRKVVYRPVTKVTLKKTRVKRRDFEESEMLSLMRAIKEVDLRRENG